MGASVSAAMEEPPSKSSAQRLAGIFFSPGAAFADVARKPDFIAPLIVSILSTLAVTETMLAKIGMERIVRATIERRSQASSLSPEQIEQRVSQGAKIGAIIAHVSGLLGAPIFLLIVAGVGLLILNGMLGSQLKFRTAFSVACYANMVFVLGSLVALAMILFGDPEHFNPESPRPTNIGFFLNPLETPKPLMSLASSFDLFTLWYLGVLGIGFSEAAGRKVKALTVFLIFFGVWMVLVLGKMGFAMLG